MEHHIHVIMHEIKKRRLTVKNIEMVAPRLKRITLTGDELSDFVSLSPDDHVKVFFPESTEDKPIMRDYTPKRFDKEKLELDLEFFLHGNGPGSQWAGRASVGQQLTIGGPRGSMIVPYDFDWYLLIGDETAVPSISRRLNEMPEGSRAIVILETEDETQKIEFQNSNSTDVYWVYRKNQGPTAESIKQLLSGIQFPEGEYYAWVFLEKNSSHAIGHFLIDQKGGHKEWIKAKGHWVKR